MKGLRLRCPSTHTVGGRRRNHSHRQRYSEKKWEGGKLTSSPVQSCLWNRKLCFPRRLWRCCSNRWLINWLRSSPVLSCLLRYYTRLRCSNTHTVIGLRPNHSHKLRCSSTHTVRGPRPNHSHRQRYIEKRKRGNLNSSPVLPSSVSPIDSDAWPLTHTKIERIG